MVKTRILNSLLVLIILSAAFVLFLVEEASAFKLIQAKGVVNKAEIGGDELKVVSLWDSGGKSFILEDGSFTTVISNQRPQKISLVDDKYKTRALTIALPQNSDNIVFNAESTALALLFQDASSFGDSGEVENFYKIIKEKPSFKNLVIFFRKNLPIKPLEELAGNEEYTALLEKCSSEILGDDHKAIKDALRTAQRELEKALP